VGVEIGLHAAKQPQGLHVTRCDIGDQMILVHLRAAGEEGGHDGDADTTADIAHQVENAGGVPHLLRLDAGHGERHQRNEQKAQGNALENLREEDVPESGVEIEAGELEHGDGPEHRADNQQTTGISFGGEVSSKRCEQQGSNAARGERQA